MAASARPISTAVNAMPSGARKEIVSAAIASSSAPASRASSGVMKPTVRALPGDAAATASSGSGLKPALRMASSASGNAAPSAVIAIVRSPSRKRSPLMPRTGSSARRISDSSTAQSMVGMRKSKDPFGMSAVSAGASAAPPQAELPQQAISAAACLSACACGTTDSRAFSLFMQPLETLKQV